MRQKAAALRGSRKEKKKLHHTVEERLNVCNIGGESNTIIDDANNAPRGSEVVEIDEPNKEGSESHKEEEVR